MTAFLWALLTAGLWGVVPVMEKIALRGASPASGIIIRSLGVLVGLAVFSSFGSPWAALRTLRWPAILLLAGAGVLASFIGQLVFYHALKSGAVSQVTPVAGAYPLVAALLGWVVLREPITVARMIGVALIIAGVWLLRR